MKKVNSQRGFALLFSVLISSLLLTIGLSIFSVTLKELSISTATRQSIHAFFAADSGREYVLYRDIKAGDLFTTGLTQSDSSISTTTKGILIAGLGPNFEVDVIKNWNDDSKTKIVTTILARGYDTDADDRVERAIEQIY